MSGYKVSVVTPFHNTDMELFKKGFESLKKQTLGFDKIEWVVVVHNSEKHYLQEVKALTEKYENVRVFELNNNVRSPSSPRNHALNNCTGEYIAFMDSDDSFNTDAFEDIVKALDETGAQIASFRAEEETEDALVLPVMDVRAMFGQTQHIINLYKGDPELNKLIYAGGLTVWCKMIRREILEDHKIRFDEHITYGEDVAFSMTCLKYTDHVIILPQTIGYIYYMHHGSLAQNMDLSPDGVMTVCNNFASLFDVAIEGGYQIERLAWPVMGYLSDLVLYNPALPEDYVNRICETMRKYLANLGDLPSDAKFFKKPAADALMAKVRSVMLGHQAPENNTSQDDTLLLSILKENENCELGQKYGFSEIDSAEEFKKRVPLTDYCFYGPLVNLSTRIGEYNLFTSRRVVGYISDFGSLQDPQKYPVTLFDYKQFLGIIESQLGTADMSTFLVTSSLPLTEKTMFKDNTCLDSVYGVISRSIKDADIFTSYRRRFKYSCITSPKELIFPSETFDLRYARLLFALADPDVSQIVAPNIWILLDLFRFLEAHWKQLVRDIENGRIGEDSGLSREIRLMLDSKLERMPDRAEALYRIFKEGFDVPDKPIVKRIWKRMKKIAANSAGGFSFYRPQLRKYTGDIAVEGGHFLHPCAVLGISGGAEPDKMRLLANNTFIELLPCAGMVAADNGTVPETVSVSEAKDKESYEIIIANHSGIYRLRTGIVFRAEKQPDETISFVYLNRRSDFAVFNDFMLDTSILGDLIISLGNDSGVTFGDYSAAVENDDSLTVYLETVSDEDQQKAAALDRKELSERFEKYLKETSGQDIAVSVKIVQPQTQLLLRDRAMPDLGACADQMRPVRILVNPRYKKMFDSLSI